MNKELIFRAVDKYKDMILDAERYIWKHPETGYREWGTQKYLAEKFEGLGYRLTYAGNIPGFYTDVETGRPGPKVLIMGELDSLICTTHPEADPETGAVHACGHNAQAAGLLGIAAALKEPGILDGLSGSVRLCAVPAEELIELGYREELRKKGIIGYYGGKVEFMYRGYFDDVDVAYMFHTAGGVGFDCGRGQNGCIVKNITFEGLASHAGGSPHMGINALYAANIGMNAINALRETFRDSDHIRVHPIVTYGGTAVNAIPNKVALESYVRGASLEAIQRENHKVNRALAASAAAMGANVMLSDRTGYAPLFNNETLAGLACDVMKNVLEPSTVGHSDYWSTGCTDMGDVGSCIPAIHPHIGGAQGASHGADYYIVNADTACVKSAKGQLLLMAALLENDAAKAKQIRAEAKLVFPSIKDYFRTMDSMVIDKHAVTYREDGKIELDF